MLSDMTLAADVAAELADPRFLTMTHYSSTPTAAGCKGPLCRLYNRDRMRKVSARRAQANGKVYKPMYKLRKVLAPVDRDEELYRIVVLHRNERNKNKQYKKLSFFDIRRTA